MSDDGAGSVRGIRTIAVGALSRVEGEGALRVRVVDGRAEIVEFNIYEPPRFFEKFLVGRPLAEVPDLVARICGICPVAYQLTACRALEKALVVEPDPAVAPLRRLLYCGEWIQSHALHVHLLHLPDFLGYESGFAMAADHPALVEAGFRMKALGNRVMEVVGGRAVHPVNVAVGGFHRWPEAAAVRGLVPDLERGLGDALELVSRVADLPFPTLAPEAEEVALAHPDEYPILEGRIASSAGLVADVDDFRAHFAERQVPWSTALHCLREPGGTPYRVGALARVNLCRDRRPPRAARAAAAAGLGRPERNPFRSIVARAVEIAAACEEGMALAAAWDRGTRGPCAALPARAGAGAHATEAPRGLLWHRYAFDAAGRIEAAAIVPPTSQNQARIEADLRAGLPEALAMDDAGATLRCEQLVRSYDPCISCATHFLTVRIDRP